MTTATLPSKARRAVWRSIKAWVLRDSSGRTRVVPVVVRHWGHRGKSNVTWSGFRGRRGEVIVGPQLKCEHDVVYRRSRPPGSMRLVALCGSCGSGTRSRGQVDQVRTRIRTAVFEIAGQPTNLDPGAAVGQAARLEAFLDFISCALKARHLRPHRHAEEVLLEDLDRHARLAGLEPSAPVHTDS